MKSKVNEDLGTLIRKHPQLLRFFHEQGVHFCAGCYLTLSATPERAAAYHGVPHLREFMRRLEHIISSPAARKHSRSAGRDNRAQCCGKGSTTFSRGGRKS